MPATNKETKKAVATKKTVSGVKKTVKRVVKKPATPKPKSPKKSSVAKDVPQKKIIAVRKVMSVPEEVEKSITPETGREIEMDDMMKDFSEDHARQKAEAVIVHPAMLPIKEVKENDFDDDEEEDEEEVEGGEDGEDKEEPEDDNFDSFRAELEEKTQHEAVYDNARLAKDFEPEDEHVYSDHLGRSVSLYRKIAYFFVALVAALLVFIFFFSVVKTTITLIPDQERVQNNLVFDVFDKDVSGAGEKAIKGIVKKIELEEAKVYQASGKKIIGEEAVGMVTIYNNYTKNQPLVATTRLLSADNKLFRIKETVNVPAGGSIDVAIYADEASPEMEIGPSKFTIPGLWAGLQNQIYAESKEAIVYQKKTQGIITREDIDNAILDLKQDLITKAEAQLIDGKEYSEIIYNVDDNSIESTTDGKIDEEKDSFEVKIKASVVAVAFNGAQALELAKQKLNNSVSANEEILSFDEKIVYALTSFDLQQGSASINATFEGKVTLKENSEIINKNKIVGLKKEQLEVYLGSLPGIAGYEVKFYPSFIKKVPKLVDRIEILIKK